MKIIALGATLLLSHCAPAHQFQVPVDCGIGCKAPVTVPVVPAVPAVPVVPATPSTPIPAALCGIDGGNRGVDGSCAGY